MNWIKITVMLTCFLLAGVSNAGARPGGNWDNRAVPVARENGIYCSLDATTIQREISHGGSTFVDVWVRYKLNEEARLRASMMSDGQPPGLKYEELDSIAVHYLFRIAPALSDHRPLKLELEKRYEGAAGEILHRDECNETTLHSKWYSLDAMEKKILLRLLTEPNFYGPFFLDPKLLTSSEEFLWTHSKEDAFYGISWGSPIETIDKTLWIGSVNLEEYQIVYTDTSIGFSNDAVKSRTPALMVFTKDKGLVEVTWQFDAAQQSAVEKKLRKDLGEPINKGGTLTWKIGQNTRCILDFDRNGQVSVVTIMAETFWKTDEIISRYL